jgi:hypothetical protein
MAHLEDFSGRVTRDQLMEPDQFLETARADEGTLRTQFLFWKRSRQHVFDSRVAGCCLVHYVTHQPAQDKAIYRPFRNRCFDGGVRSSIQPACCDGILPRSVPAAVAVDGMTLSRGYSLALCRSARV